VSRPRLHMTIVVPFLNEEEHLPVLLDSLAGQHRIPDVLVLVDDGSVDRSAGIARRFADRHPWARLLRRPRRRPARDRMAQAHEWRAFAWGLSQVTEPWDLAAKLDADLRLPAGLLGEMEDHFLDEPRLGIAGAYLSQTSGGGRVTLQRCAPGHVEGPTRFYRRACLEAISPVPAILGWDTIDEVRARLRGWDTRSFRARRGEVVHLRRLGSYDGVLRGYRRAGWAAYAYGADPLHLLASTAARLGDRPPVACGVAYLGGYVAAALRDEPRAEREVRARVRSEQRARLGALARRRAQ
jgi:biofilm PGA synthesis N-glycosyltransferase PgaC